MNDCQYKHRKKGLKCADFNPGLFIFLGRFMGSSMEHYSPAMRPTSGTVTKLLVQTK